MPVLLCAVLLLSKADDGKSVYDAWVKKLHDAKTFSGTMVTGTRAEPKTTTFRLMKPNFQDIVGPLTEYHADGNRAYVYQVDKKQYFSSPAKFGGSVGNTLPGCDAFGSEDKPMAYQGEDLVTFDDQEAYAVDVKSAKKSALAGDLRATYYFSKRSGELLGYRQMIGSDVFSGRYSKLTFDTAMDPKSFIWAIPADAKPYSGG